MWGPFDGDLPIPLGRPSVRYYPWVHTDSGPHFLAVCADHYAAERELEGIDALEDYVNMGIDIRVVAGPGTGLPPLEGI